MAMARSLNLKLLSGIALGMPRSGVESSRRRDRLVGRWVGYG